MSGVLDTDALKYFVVLEGVDYLAVKYLACANATKCSVLNGSGSCFYVTKILVYNITDISSSTFHRLGLLVAILINHNHCPD